MRKINRIYQHEQKKEQNIRVDMWDNDQIANNFIVGGPEGEEEE